MSSGVSGSGGGSVSSGVSKSGSGGSGGGTLYIVATPIGNAEDITARAARALAEADAVAAEDTRSAGLLLKALNIRAKLVSNHKFNEKYREDYILSMLESGKDVAVISDAGTPCVSDPGGIVVRAAAERGFRVVPVCGASAVTAALSVCGFEFTAFAFYGFMPRTASEIKKLIAKIGCGADGARGLGGVSGAGGLGGAGFASVFFESPKRIKKTMETLSALAPGAECCLCNDLTKQYERIYRGAPAKILGELAANPSAEKGEYTLVCMFSGAESRYQETELSPEAVIADYMVKNGCTAKDAVDALVRKRGYKKKELYEATLNLNKLFMDKNKG